MRKRILVTIDVADDGEQCGDCDLYVIDGYEQLCCAFGDGFLGVDRTPRIRLPECIAAEQPPTREGEP